MNHEILETHETVSGTRAFVNSVDFVVLGIDAQTY